MPQIYLNQIGQTNKPKRLKLRFVFPLQVTVSMEQTQLPLQTEPQTELHKDVAMRNEKTPKNDTNCSHTADPMASADSRKNKGWSKHKYPNSS